MRAAIGEPGREGDARRIRAVCGPCREFLPDTNECRLLRRGAERLRIVFADKRCRPQEFTETLLRRRLRGTAERAAPLRDLTSQVVVDLLQRPPRGPLGSSDLPGLRRLLAGRTHRVHQDHVRGQEGDLRCSDCVHQRVGLSGTRKCTHPDPTHPWAGREVRGDLDPRGFEPPCLRYRTRREALADVVRGQDSLRELPAFADSPGADVAGHELAGVLLDGLAAVQRQDPRAHFAVWLSVFRRRSDSEIAGALGATLRAVSHHLERGLLALHAELAGRGIPAAEAGKFDEWLGRVAATPGVGSLLARADAQPALPEEVLADYYADTLSEAEVDLVARRIAAAEAASAFLARLDADVLAASAELEPPRRVWETFRARLADAVGWFRSR